MAAVSGTNSAFNDGASSAFFSSGVFDLTSAWLTAAWNNGLDVRVIGKNAGNTLFDNTYTLSATAPTFIGFNYLGVDQVLFSSSGGTPHQPYVQFGGGTHFAIDDITINGSVGVPDSASTSTLLLAGASFLLFVARKKRV